jgi:20S proteasome subunit alpha 5
MFANPSIYDMSTHVFSPAGALMQIEYAHAAAGNGSSAIGIKTREGVVFVTERSRFSNLLVSSSLDKVHIVAGNCLSVYSGIVADAAILLNKARVEAENHWFTYDEHMSLRSICRAVAEVANNYADPDIPADQRIYSRPFGVSFIFAGIEQPFCYIH